MTLKQVAQVANVSIKTVSRALNGDGPVSETTRRQILSAAAQVGYVPNRAARMMRSPEAQIVGLMAHFVTTSPFTTDIMRAVESVVDASGRALLIADSGPGGTERAMRLFQEFRADPVIFATSYHMAADEVFAPGQGRAILVNCYLNAPDVRSFVPDDEGGGYAQARHLIELGHRRIAVIELPEGMIARDLRRRGAMRAFAEAGIAWDDAMVRVGQTGPRADRRTVAYEAALDLLSHAERPTAILCSKDEFALQAYGAAAELGLSVPKDVSIIGFDDVHVIAGTMRPGLTTVRLPYFEMGRRAAASALGDEDPGPGCHLVPCDLVVRSSCAEV